MGPWSAAPRGSPSRPDRTRPPWRGSSRVIPTPIPDDEVWMGATRRVIGPPVGKEPWAIPPVEVLQELTDQGPLIHVRIAFEPDDVRRIKEGSVDHFWLTLWSDHLHAFNVQLPAEVAPDGD